MPESKKPIIIKKIKKGGGGHHGGAWKVAYADFVTAMMAFFLLLWLLTMVSEEKKMALSRYFNEFNIFEHGGKLFLSGEGGGSPITETAKPSKFPPTKLEEGDEMPPKMKQDIKDEQSDSEMESLKVVEIKKEQFKAELTKIIEQKLKDLQNQILIEVVDKGVRIQLVDQEKGTPMFEKGSINLTETAKRALMVITDALNEMPNKIAIEGHTDALSFSGTRYTNWELSTDRASAARRAMEEFGLNPKRIIQVAGYADTQLLIKDNPNDPRNRRISILVAFTPEQKAKIGK